MKKILVLLLSLAMVSGCSTSTTPDASTETESYTYADTIVWDAEYDVVVAGIGGAGAVAARFASDEGADVLILEKMDDTLSGGNTKVCAQRLAYGNGDYENTLAYYTQLGGDNPQSDALLHVVAEGVANAKETLMEFYDLSDEEIFVFDPIAEYPEFNEAKNMTKINMLNPDGSNGRIYDRYLEYVFDRADSIDVWYESPAVELIQDPTTKTIIGVKTQRNGEILNVRANNGVVLATGGFECNEQMVKDYLGLGEFAYMGGSYNTGDGIKMAQAVGAELVHMETFEGGFNNLSYSLNVGSNNKSSAFPGPINGSCMTVGAGGKRFYDENFYSRHGHVYNNNSWTHPAYPNDAYVVFTQKYMDMLNEKENKIADFPDDLYTGATIEELAANANIDVQGLTETVAAFNKYTAEGYDPEFRRPGESMEAFTEGPYYAVHVLPVILNTQGGPKKNENAEVIDVTGNVIPHLYVAGEISGGTTELYSGGTNMSECLIFGKIAGTNAAAEKEALPAYEPLAKVESTPTKVTEVTDVEKVEVELAEGEFLGVGSGIGGKLYLKVAFDGETIKSIEVVKHGESEGICEPAFEQVPAQIIETQSTEVDTVSGATITSKGIIEAVNDAIAQNSK